MNIKKHLVASTFMIVDPIVDTAEKVYYKMEDGRSKVVSSYTKKLVDAETRSQERKVEKMAKEIESLRRPQQAALVIRLGQENLDEKPSRAQRRLNRHIRRLNKIEAFVASKKDKLFEDSVVVEEDIK